ncbi:MAG: hypothetical protein KME09_25760 [Pleurocapsa minor HA4230-MV1]|nr:hypothetical protein [Pleurocapsa minor HA4230-MV1]
MMQRGDAPPGGRSEAPNPLGLILCDLLVSSKERLHQEVLEHLSYLLLWRALVNFSFSGHLLIPTEDI